MAGSLNRVILIGNVGNDPEVRSFNNGGKVANFSLATSETWKDKQSGERKEKTEWHRIAVFSDGLVSVIERYVQKGSKVAVEGKLQTRKWTDRDGNDKYTTEVVIQGFGGSLILLGSKNDGGGGGNQSGYGGGRSSNDSGGYRDRGGSGGYGKKTKDEPKENFDLDDEIPF